VLFGHLHPGGFASRKPPVPVMDFVQARCAALPPLANVHPGVGSG
jgi:hypothetical protein